MPWPRTSPAERARIRACPSALPCGTRSRSQARSAPPGRLARTRWSPGCRRTSARTRRTRGTLICIESRTACELADQRSRLYCELVDIGTGGCGVVGTPKAALVAGLRKPVVVDRSTSFFDQPSALSRSQVPRVYLQARQDAVGVRRDVGVARAHVVQHALVAGVGAERVAGHARAEVDVVGERTQPRAVGCRPVVPAKNGSWKVWNVSTLLSSRPQRSPASSARSRRCRDRGSRNARSPAGPRTRS